MLLPVKLVFTLWIRAFGIFRIHHRTTRSRTIKYKIQFGKNIRSTERETRQIGKILSRIYTETLYGSCAVVDE